MLDALELKSNTKTSLSITNQQVCLLELGSLAYLVSHTVRTIYQVAKVRYVPYLTQVKYLGTLKYLGGKVLGRPAEPQLSRREESKILSHFDKRNP